MKKKKQKKFDPYEAARKLDHIAMTELKRQRDALLSAAKRALTDEHMWFSDLYDVVKKCEANTSAKLSEAEGKYYDALEECKSQRDSLLGATAALLGAYPIRNATAEQRIARMMARRAIDKMAND